jgi:molybdopterin-guanine dinucleotide biosynthesis protein A
LAADRILGVILAGGASRRFGSDKSAALLGGRPLLEWVIEHARPQCGMLLLNANDPAIGRGIADLERLVDSAPGEGPLAGILTALGRAGRRGFECVASFACDTPFFPLDTVARLADAVRTSSADYAVARCGDTAHRIFALWPVACRDRLDAAFAQGARSMAGVEDWLVPAWVGFSPEGGPEGDPFFNINTRDDLEKAERWIRRDESPN